MRFSRQKVSTTHYYSNFQNTKVFMTYLINEIKYTSSNYEHK